MRAVSIRWRLTLWYTLALAVVLLGFTGLVYGLMRHALYERLDRSLLAELQELEHRPNQDLAYWLKEAKEHQNIFGVVYDATGRVYQRTEELPEAAVPSMPATAVGERQFLDATLPIIAHQRFLAARLNAGGKEVTILLMADLDDVDRELHELLTVLAMAVPASLVTAGGLGYLLARKALSPVQQLHRSTEEITADHLDRRLPVANAKDELGQLTQTINAMIGRLERSFVEIRRFTADASHELRTPLTAIRTETEIALRQSLNTADYRHLLGSILEECERLTRLTDQLLTLSREDAGVVCSVRKSVELAALLDSVVETMRPLAEAKGLHLCRVGEGEIRVLGDEVRLRQVFYNLLDNAIKYTPEGGTVEVRLARRHRGAVVTVRDNGIGIPAEHLPRVFDRFYRVDKARSREEGGTGLGLSIAKIIITAHDGQIDLTSTPGQGTLCTVTLPAEPNG
jgi:heavy metal sensor kinase